MLHSGLVCVLLGLLCCNVCLVIGDLRADLHDFMALVPRRRISFLAARYQVFDPRFRQASDFLRSNEFGQTWQQINAAPSFTDIVDYVNDYGSGYDVGSVVSKLPNRLRAFQISRVVPMELMLRRDLSTFLHDAVQSLPRAQITNLMVRKVREGGEFSRLYKALKQKDFRQLVSTARHARDLQAPLSQLQKNQINVDEIIKIFYELISWGP